jgi:hypothetical protein
MRYRQENGRTYHAYKDGGNSNRDVCETRSMTDHLIAYAVPNDEVSLSDHLSEVYDRTLRFIGP